jgi:hypothetical protein
MADGTESDGNAWLGRCRCKLPRALFVFFLLSAREYIIEALLAALLAMQTAVRRSWPEFKTYLNEMK